MKRIAPVIAIVMALVLSACGTSSKFKNKTAEESSTKLQETTATATDLDTKTRTITIEKADTSVKVPASATRSETPISALLAGDTVTATTGPTTVRGYLDMETGTLHLQAETKAQDVPIQIDRTTISETESKATTVSATETNLETGKSKENEVKTSERSGMGSIEMVAALVLFLLCVLAGLWLAVRNFRP